MAVAAPSITDQPSSSEQEDPIMSVQTFRLDAGMFNYPTTVTRTDGKYTILSQSQGVFEGYYDDYVTVILTKVTDTARRHIENPPLYTGTLSYGKGKESGSLDQVPIRVMRDLSPKPCSFLVFETLDGKRRGLMSDQENVLLPMEEQFNLFTRKGNKGRLLKHDRICRAAIGNPPEEESHLSALSKIRSIELESRGSYSITVTVSDQAAVFTTKNPALLPKFMSLKPSDVEAGGSENPVLFTGYFKYFDNGTTAYIPVQVTQHGSGFIVRSQGDPKKDPIVYCRLSKEGLSSDFPKELPSWQEEL